MKHSIRTTADVASPRPCFHSRAALALALAGLTLGGCSKTKDEQPAKSDNNKVESKDKAEDKTDELRPSVIRVTGIPDENPTELARSYQPLVDYLSAALGTKVEYVPVTDYGAAVQALAAKKVDFAWLGGFTYVQARNMSDAVPLAQRDIDREFHSVFIVNSEAKIKSPADLKGKTFAFGSKSSTSGHLMPRHFLATEHSIDPDKDFDGKPVFSGAHDATAKMVEQGKVAAGALNKQVWDRLVSDKAIDTSKVSVLWTTPPYVDYVWTSRASIHLELRTLFTKAFLALDEANPEHKPILERLGARKYVVAKPSDFDAIETVGKQTGLLK